MATKAQEKTAVVGGDASQQIKHFDNLRNILKSAKHSSGQDLYTHLVEVMNHIVMHCPEQGLDKFEEISYLLKQQKDGKIASLSEFLKVSEERAYSRPGKDESSVKYLNKAKKFFEKQGGAPAEGEAAAEGDGAGDAGASAGPVGFVPDLLADARTYQWAGIGFGDNETLLLAKSLKQLSASAQASHVRLWGKIHGSMRDYYIAEGFTEAGQGAEGEEKPAGFEARGSGVNKYVYWACNSPLDGWTQLPDLAPSDIQAAREVKVLFTGDLERRIVTNPFFFKREKHFLRAQISRIAFGTTLAPKGLYRPTEENPKEIEDNNPAEGALVIPSTLAMGKADMWVHHTQNILRCNRLAHLDAGAEGDESGELMKKIEAADPYEPRLKSITLDARVKGGLPAWVVKHHGEHDVFGTPKNPNDKQNFGTVVVKSLQWPGAHTFFTGGRWTSIYVGDGLKHEQKSFYPVFPPKIREDPVEKACYHEPNPRGYDPNQAQQPVEQKAEDEQ